MKIKSLIILLSALLAVSLVSAITFKNAILLQKDTFNDFGIRLNDSFEVTGDINISLFNRSKTAPISGIGNDIGYSSKTSINLNDLVFYKEDGSQSDYQDAITNEWILSIRQFNFTKEDGTFGVCDPLIESGATACPEWDKDTLDEYDSVWLTSYLAVKMKFPNVGGSNSSTLTNLSYSNITFYNGTNFLGITDALTEGWWGDPTASTNLDFIEFFNEPDDIEKFVCLGTGGDFDIDCIKTELNTWGGYRIYTNKSNIYLLFENKTIPPPNKMIVQLKRDETAKNNGVIGVTVQLKRDNKAKENGIVRFIQKLMRLI